MRRACRRDSWLPSTDRSGPTLATPSRRVSAKFVLGENISQTAQFAQSGNADVGIVALSLALGPALKAAGTYVEIPSAFHPPIEQAAVVVAKSARKDLARRFVDALKQPAIVKLLQQYGFATTPSATACARRSMAQRH